MTARSRHYLLFSLCCLAGCGSTPPPAVVEDSPYYPLRVGTKWVYQGPGQQRIVEVVRHAQMEGKRAAVVETHIADKLVAVEHLYADKNGLFILAIGNKPLIKPLPFLRLPPKTGRTWTVNFKGAAESQTFQIGTDHVSVPYGAFDAITLRSDLYAGSERKLSNVYWFARDIGIIKQVIHADDKLTTYELVEFTKGKSEF